MPSVQPKISPKPVVRLVARGDDAGSCESANLAIIESIERGILGNVSLMVPGPAFEHFVQVFTRVDRSDVNLGLHITLNAEWEHPRWGPVAGASRTPGLVDAQGMFFPLPSDLEGRNVEPEQIWIELQAQYQRGIDAGLRFSYLDEHMGVGWVADFRSIFRRFAAEHGLVMAEDVPSMPWREGVMMTSAALIEHLRSLDQGTYVMVTHPGMDRPDMRSMVRSGRPTGEVARERDQDRRLLTDPALREGLRRSGVELVLYTQAGRVASKV
jgi:predicted glycoside hydrolase/deacetylase ChbG (UPF0249 family)